MKIAFPFSRPSPAYLQDGTQVASGLPRYEVGQFGKGITIEEGTTNLLTANQSNVETDTTGFSANPVAGTATITRDTTVYYSGSASLKVVTNGISAWEGFATTKIPATAGLAYSAQTRIKGASGVVRFILKAWDASNNALGEKNIDVTLDNTWQLIKVENYVLPTNTTQVSIIVVTFSTAQAITFYCDALQIEQKSYATSWQIGGTARAAETCTIPTAGVFNKGGWTFEVIYEPITTGMPQAVGHILDLRVNINNRYGLIRDGNSRPYLFVTSGGTTYSTYTVSAPVMQVGSKYRLTIRGNGTTIALFVNGVKYGGDVAYVEPVGTLPSNMDLGQISGWYANGIYDDLRISSRARTDAEILADYERNVPLPVDEYTTCKASFNESLYAFKNRLIKPILRPNIKPWLIH